MKKTMFAAAVLCLCTLAIAGGLNVMADFSPYVGESHDRLCVDVGGTAVTVESMECNEQFNIVALSRSASFAALSTQGTVRITFDPPVFYVAGQISAFKDAPATFTCYGNNAFGPNSTGLIRVQPGWTSGLGTPNNDETLWEYCDVTHGQMYRFHIKPQS